MTDEQSAVSDIELGNAGVTGAEKLLGRAAAMTKVQEEMNGAQRPRLSAEGWRREFRKMTALNAAEIKALRRSIDERPRICFGRRQNISLTCLR